MSNSKPSWWSLDSGEDVSTGWGLHCATCGQIACTCHLGTADDLASQLDPGSSLTFTIWRRNKPKRRRR